MSHGAFSFFHRAARDEPTETTMEERRLNSEEEVNINESDGTETSDSEGSENAVEEEAFSNSSALLRLLPDAACLLDRRGKVRNVNQRFSSLLHISPPAPFFLSQYLQESSISALVEALRRLRHQSSSTQYPLLLELSWRVRFAHQDDFVWTLSGCSDSPIFLLFGRYSTFPA